MVFTSNALLALFAFAPAALAIPGPTWYKRQADAQTSLTLDPAVISPGLAQDGQGNNPDPAQVRSLTSKNNFINFCLTQNTALTNGKQVVEGSCNPTPMGRIISFDRAPASKFVFPKNTDSSIQADQPFTIQMKVRNMVLGNFVNAQSNYYAAPQQVNQQGLVIGHTHVVIETLSSFDATEPLDPINGFVFFKGVNGAPNDAGVVTAAVDKGIKAGFYRLCSINTAANHQPVLLSNAQHGALDDCVYFAVGQGNDPFKLNGGNGANASASASDSTAASSSSAPAANQSAAPGQNDNQNGGNNQQGGNNNQQQQGGNNNQQQQGGNNNANNNQQQQGGNNANNANANAQGGNRANNNNQRQGGGNNN